MDHGFSTCSTEEPLISTSANLYKQQKFKNNAHIAAVKNVISTGQDVIKNMVISASNKDSAQRRLLQNEFDKMSEESMFQCFIEIKKEINKALNP